MSFQIAGTNKKLTYTVNNGGTDETFDIGVDNTNDRAYIQSDAAAGLSLNTNTFLTTGSLKLQNPSDTLGASSNGIAAFSAPVLSANVITTLPASSAASTYLSGITVNDSGESVWVPPGVVYVYHMCGPIVSSAVGAKVTMRSHSSNFATVANYIDIDTVNHVFTIPEGMWLIKFSAGNNGPGNLGSMNLQLYNEDTSTYIGPGLPIRLPNSGNQELGANLLLHTVTHTSSVTYSIRVTSIGGTNPTLSDDYAAIMIERIALVANAYATSG